jgi:hypothetical protein
MAARALAALELLHLELQIPAVAVAVHIFPAQAQHLVGLALLYFATPTRLQFLIPAVGLHLLLQQLALIKLRPLLPAPATYLLHNHNGTLRIPG